MKNKIKARRAFRLQRQTRHVSKNDLAKPMFENERRKFVERRLKLLSVGTLQIWLPRPAGKTPAGLLVPGIGKIARVYLPS